MSLTVLHMASHHDAWCCYPGHQLCLCKTACAVSALTQCSAHNSNKLLQGYWQSAIAARPSAAHTGYLLGGIMWFCIPFTLATTMGLAALAADLPITLEEAGSGKRLASLSGLCAGQCDGDAAERSRLCGTALG